jgi:hypothetical protein
VAREHRMKARARAAVAGVARDTLAGRIEAYGDDTVTLSIPSEGIVTMAKRLLPESMVGDAYVGSWLLFEMPQLTKMSDGTPRLDAIRCEYVGDSPAIATSWLAGEVVVGALALLASMAAAVGLARALTFIAYGS